MKSPEQIEVILEEEPDRLAAFAILMEGNNGVSSKSPDYMLEKLIMCLGIPHELLDGMLDPNNEQKLARWRDMWMKEKK